MMNKIFYMILAFMPFTFIACSNDDDYVSEPSAVGTVVDDMGNEYEWVRIGNLDWTTSNALNGLSVVDAEFFDERWSEWDYIVSESEYDYVVDEYIPRYGNLMSYEEALKSAPDGWRLPTDEDWKNLERALGMSDSDANSKGWRGNNGVGSRMMEANSGVGLALMLGGGAIYTKDDYLNSYKQEIDYVLEAGYYWTATIEPVYTEVPMGYYRKLVSGCPGVERQCTRAANLMSVRWCRDAQTN